MTQEKMFEVWDSGKILNLSESQIEEQYEGLMAKVKSYYDILGLELWESSSNIEMAFKKGIARQNSKPIRYITDRDLELFKARNYLTKNAQLVDVLGQIYSYCVWQDDIGMCDKKFSDWKYLPQSECLPN